MTEIIVVLTVYSSRATSPPCKLPHNLLLRIDHAITPPSGMLLNTLVPLKGNSEVHASSHMRTASHVSGWEEGGTLG